MNIPSDLKNLISNAIKLLGSSIQEIYGSELYKVIENLRVKMKGVRGLSPEKVQKALNDVYAEMSIRDTQDLHQVAKAFSLMLEIINACEAAYRSHRLGNYQVSYSKKPHSLVFVFTSHPTEARSRDYLFLLDKVELLLSRALKENFDEIKDELNYLLKVALRINLANNRRPQVKDEAEQIFHTVMDQKILAEQVELRKKGIDVYFRTWVGGDKDGHPNVGAETMIQSLSLSRGMLLDFVQEQIRIFESEISLMSNEEKLLELIRTTKSALKGAKKVTSNDGKIIETFHKEFKKLFEEADRKNLISPSLKSIEQINWLYPALVLPLEIREDSELIKKALHDNSQPIVKMLETLKKISKGMNAKWYVRGFVISMCQTTEDLLAAATLTKKKLGSFSIPVVPLFENEKGLSSAVEILKGGMSEFPFEENHNERWGGRFEMMLGYSDSSKENGVLPGRLLVEEALIKLDKFIRSKKLTPVFFHGSGGSASRGGGSIKEQIAWFPQSALNIYKVTIQGETVQRHFHDPLIMRSQVGKIVEEFNNFTPKKFSRPESIIKLSGFIQSAYRELVNDQDFQELTSSATPYDFLSLLKMGSRPSKRAGKGKFTIRAIPWILCWTQTRLLLPIWWGTGSGWSQLNEAEKDEMRQFYKTSPLLQSFVKSLGFSLAKIEMGVWDFHVAHSGLSDQDQKSWKKTIMNEYTLAVRFFKELSGEDSFTWFRPWLGESIYFRSSMIHPLNVIQKIALERKDRILLRETVTGIACGMLTTG